VVLVQLIAGVGVVDGDDDDVATAASVNQTKKNTMYAIVTDYQSAVIS